jgi:DNA polymerase-1
MYPEIAAAVERGELLLEWDKSKGAPPAPLLKEKHAGERRKAKTLNFSIAYGKTAMGLSKDWNVSHREAEETLERWYKDRPEVKEWQQRTIDLARQTGYTRTLLGRYRKLPDINHPQRSFRAHSERAAINTPLQGGAADVVIRAMVKVRMQHADVCSFSSVIST